MDRRALILPGGRRREPLELSREQLYLHYASAQMAGEGGQFLQRLRRERN